MFRTIVFSIWILDSPLFKDAGTYHLKFGLHDSENNISLSDHLTIHLLQLSLFDEHKEICNETERWLYFFKQAENQDINSLPDVLKTKEMKQAMETLQDFSENQKNYLLYQSRLDAEFERNTWKKMAQDFDRKLQNTMMNLEVERKEKEKERQEKEKALQSQEKERQEKEKALKEKALYLKILKEKGFDIDTLALSPEHQAE